jgi:hypothetical protein
VLALAQLLAEGIRVLYAIFAQAQTVTQHIARAVEKRFRRRICRGTEVEEGLFVHAELFADLFEALEGLLIRLSGCQLKRMIDLGLHASRNRFWRYFASPDHHLHFFCPPVGKL